MSRFVSVVVSSFFAVAVQAAIGAAAFAQDQPAVEPAPGEAAPLEPPRAAPPPVARESATRPAVFDNPGVDFGARVGYALPMGKEDGSDNLSDDVSGAVPLVLEVGYRLNGNFTIGALFQYGVGQIHNTASNGCGTGGIDCSASVIRLGIEGIYNFNLEGTFTPWVGIGTGYEWLNLSASLGGQSGSLTASGFEFATLQVGGDFRLAPQFALGPFLSMSLAEYRSVSLDGAAGSGSMDLTDKKLHEWLQFGVRGRFGI